MAATGNVEKATKETVNFAFDALRDVSKTWFGAFFKGIEIANGFVQSFGMLVLFILCCVILGSKPTYEDVLAKTTYDEEEKKKLELIHATLIFTLVVTVVSFGGVVVAGVFARKVQLKTDQLLGVNRPTFRAFGRRR